MNLDPRTLVGPTLAVAQWVSATRYADLPHRTREVTRNALLDTLGAGLYGVGTQWAGAVRDWALEGSGFAGGQGEARVWGSTSARLRAADAALVNGVAAHAFELDDYHNAKLHAGAVVIPAAIALAEKLDLDGEKLLTAIAIGYEVMIRTSLALGPSAARLRGWHITGITGPFGAAAACASLLGLDAERTAWALGLAGTQGAGTWAFNADGTMSKRLHPGRSAHAGVLAAELASRGFSGPTQIYEFQDGGFLRAFADSTNVAPLTDGLGSHYHLDATSVKPYSCCGSTHSYIDAARELRRRFGAPWDPQRKVRVGLSKVVDVQCGFDYQPSSTLNAQMSLRFCIAVALMDGQALPKQFDDARLKDPATIALAGALDLVPDPELDKLYPANFAGWVAAEAGGRSERVDVMNPTGSPSHPISFDGLVEKFRGVVSGPNVDTIVAAVRDVEQRKVRAFLGLLAPVAGA